MSTYEEKQLPDYVDLEAGDNNEQEQYLAEKSLDTEDLAFRQEREKRRQRRLARRAAYGYLSFDYSRPHGFHHGFHGEDRGGCRRRGLFKRIVAGIAVSASAFGVFSLGRFYEQAVGFSSAHHRPCHPPFGRQHRPDFQHPAPPHQKPPHHGAPPHDGKPEHPGKPDHPRKPEHPGKPEPPKNPEVPEAIPQAETTVETTAGDKEHMAKGNEKGGKGHGKKEQRKGVKGEHSEETN